MSSGEERWLLPCASASAGARIEPRLYEFLAQEAYQPVLKACRSRLGPIGPGSSGSRSRTGCRCALIAAWLACELTKTYLLLLHIDRYVIVVTR